MKLSNRITGLTDGGSDGWDIHYHARSMIAEGHPVAMLTIGEHDVGTDRSILEAMHAAALAGHTGYTLFQGNANLREAIAKRVSDRTKLATAPENVLVVPGGQAGLFVSHIATCGDGGKALYIDPNYATYPGTIRAAGAEPVAVMARPDRDFQPDPRDIANAAEDARCLLINTPNNPTGVVYNRRTIEGIASVCRKNDMWLISDEVYDTQVWRGVHISPRTLAGMAERTLVVGSLSKSHAMTGSRIGWVIGPEEAIHHMGNLTTNTTYGIPGYIQEAGLFALGCGEDFEKKIAAPFRRRGKMVVAMIKKQNLIKAVPSDGGMYVMLDIKSTGLSGRDFAAHLLNERHVAVMPGESFGQSASGHVRVALTVADDILKNAVASLIEFATEFALVNSDIKKRGVF